MDNFGMIVIKITQAYWTLISVTDGPMGLSITSEFFLELTLRILFDFLDLVRAP